MEQPQVKVHKNSNDNRPMVEQAENPNQRPLSRLTETEPNEPAGTKTSAFRRFLNALWGPIRG